MQVWLLPSSGTAGHGETWKVSTTEGQEAHLCRQQYRLRLSHKWRGSDLSLQIIPLRTFQMPWMRLCDLQQSTRSWLAHEKDPQGWYCWMWRVWSEGARPQEAQGDPSQVRANWLESWWMSTSFFLSAGDSRSTLVPTVVTSTARKKI